MNRSLDNTMSQSRVLKGLPSVSEIIDHLARVYSRVPKEEPLLVRGKEDAFVPVYILERFTYLTKCKQSVIDI